MKQLIDKLIGKEKPTPVPQGETFTRGKKSRIAVYIDIDDATAQDVPFVFEALEAEGLIEVRRYFSSLPIDNIEAEWFEVIESLAIEPSEITGTSHSEIRAADIALSIDAVHTMISKEVDLFVLVTSDASFTPLVDTLKQYGKKVYVFGSIDATDIFKASCTQFFESEHPSKKAFQAYPIEDSPVYYPEEPELNPEQTAPLENPITEIESEAAVEQENSAPVSEQDLETPTPVKKSPFKVVLPKSLEELEKLKEIELPKESKSEASKKTAANNGQAKKSAKIQKEDTQMKFF